MRLRGLGRITSSQEELLIKRHERNGARSWTACPRYDNISVRIAAQKQWHREASARRSDMKLELNARSALEGRKLTLKTVVKAAFRVTRRSRRRFGSR